LQLILSTLQERKKKKKQKQNFFNIFLNLKSHSKANQVMSNRQASQQQPTAAPANLATPQAQTLQSNVLTPSAAAIAITKSKVDYVQVDALVVLKILKHCHELGGGAELVQGILTGMINYPDGASTGPKRIEITNCFGLPNPNTFKAGSPDYNQGRFGQHFERLFHYTNKISIFYKI
jgi:hypothetical protein